VERMVVPSIEKWGEWAINNMIVRVESNVWAKIEYTKYEMNGDTYYKNVILWFWDKFQGVTLEEKVQRKMNKLIDKLKKKNINISKCREMSERLNEKYSNK
jgi:hypothetical protein